MVALMVGGDVFSRLVTLGGAESAGSPVSADEVVAVGELPGGS